MAKTRLQEKYLSEAVKGMMDKFNYKNVMEIPKIEKVVINMGIGEAVANSKALDSAVADLTLIAGQRPVITKAKKSIAAFKLRQGDVYKRQVVHQAIVMQQAAERQGTSATKTRGMVRGGGRKPVSYTHLYRKTFSSLFD